MPVSEKQKEYAKKYHQEKTDELKVRLPKGDKAKLQEHAASYGESTNGFVKRAIDEAMARDNANATQPPAQ